MSIRFNHSHIRILFFLVLVSVLAVSSFFIKDVFEANTINVHDASPSPSQASTASTQLLAKLPAQAKDTCNTFSPFGEFNPACNSTAVSIDLAKAKAYVDPSLQEAQKHIKPMPAFSSISTVGDAGNGVVASLLKSAGRNISENSSISDSTFIDGFSQPSSVVVSAVRDALNSQQHVILDGVSTKESSDKIGQIMLDLKLMHLPDTAAYIIGKNLDGSFSVTPLQSIPDEKGVRKFDQINNIFGIEKSF
jgi:hypothetical protein